MKLSKEQELEMLKSIGIDRAGVFFERKKLVYSNESFLIYEDENKNIDCITFDDKGVLSVHGHGELLVHDYVSTKVHGDGSTKIYGDGFAVINDKIVSA